MRIIIKLMVFMSVFIARSFSNIWYCKKFTTEHTEKILFKALSCQPLALSYFVSSLCVLSIIILFFPLLVITPIKFISSHPLCPVLQKSSAPIPYYAINQDTIPRLFPLKDILWENTENPSFRLSSTSKTVKLCGFI